MPDKQESIAFRVQHGWAMVSELFGDKVRIRATKIGKAYRVSDEHNQHRCNEFECEGTVRVQPKRIDISEFTAPKI